MKRLTLEQFRKQNGITNQEWQDYLRDLVFEGVVPALCSEGCEVEPDGRCPHRCPSVLIAAGYM